MDIENINILYDFVKLIKFSLLRFGCGSDAWSETMIFLIGGALRDDILEIKPVDYDLHIKTHYPQAWLMALKNVIQLGNMFGCDLEHSDYKLMTSFLDSENSQSLKIIFRGIIIDVFIFNPSNKLMTKNIPFFIVNSCYTYLKEKGDSMSEPGGYRFKSSKNSIITLSDFCESCKEKKLVLNPGWDRNILFTEKAEYRYYQAQFLYRLSRMMKKGFCLEKKDIPKIEKITEILLSLICPICQCTMEESLDNTDIIMTKCCYTFVHHSCISRVIDKTCQDCGNTKCVNCNTCYKGGGDNYVRVIMKYEYISVFLA